MNTTPLKVAVVMGSSSDQAKMSAAADLLADFGVEATVHIMSAHRNPELVADFARTARDQGYGVVICGAGMAAALPGVVAAHTILPVIGVPLSGSALNGVDALYATVQMPRGVPVASVAIDGASNAALLAIEILAVADSDLADKLVAYRRQWVAP
ncbi:MAG: 5-(carboxyamino)imidazole ribonucleotide mutase [Actinomycetota bacterium]|nr:5-(carboxyamino)imidazole ribonucleotide mutase [Actinomycetota bacterium]